MYDFPTSPTPRGDLLDPLAFTPVPTERERADGWTPRRQHDFIQALSVMGVVARAARAVGKTKQSAYALRRRPGAESWTEAWDLAVQMGYDRAFADACDRALNGVVSPRFYKGKQVGTRHRFDYRLALAALNPPALPQPRNKVAR